MRAGQGRDGAGRGPRAQAGYSLVEMMVAVVVASIVGVGLYAIFNATQRSSLSQRIYNDMQTSCTFAMDQMKSELLLAGYRAPVHPDGQTYPIASAGASSVTVEYFDDNARNEGPYATGYSGHTRVTYSVSAGSLQRRFERFQGTDFDTVNVTTQTLATNVGALTFSYFGDDNVPWTSGDVRDIRTLRAELTCNAARPDPNTNRTPQITLTAEVRARNVDVAGTPSDVTPPGEPQNLVSWDPGQCGTLQLRWDARTEADLEGYVLYYGLAAGSYSERVVINRPPRAAGSSEFYTVTGLDSAVTGVSPPPQYYFALASFDKSGNVSPSLSNEASGDPDPSARDATEQASYGTDTTVNPDVPDAPVALTATPGEGSITLTWTASPATGLQGYRLFRGDAPDFVPDDTPVTGNLLKDWNSGLGATATSYTDTGLLGCTPYYYKLAAVACDTEIPVDQLQFAEASAEPLDSVRPTTPNLVAKPGYKRVILNLDNHADPDFVFTKIWYSTADYPTMDPATGVVSGGDPIPDSNTTPFSAGTIGGTGTTQVDFNSLANGSWGFHYPELPSCTNQAEVDAGTAACNQITYYFLAVAYDRCENHSEVTDVSISQGSLCADCNEGEVCEGAPPAPEGITTSGCSGTDGITITWNEYDVLTERDLAGFHVWRCEGPTCADGGVELTDGNPTWFTYWNDTSGAVTNPLAEGVVYSYRIEATDCYYERRNLPPPPPATWGSNLPFDNYAATTTSGPAGGLSVGRVDRDPSLPQVVSGYLEPTARPLTISLAEGLTTVPPTFRHNTVTNWVKNTSGGNLQLQQANLSWENPAAYLQLVAFGDGATTPVKTGWRDTTVPLTKSGAGSAVTLGADARLTASDERIPLVLRFRNADGSVTQTTDSRQQEVDLTLAYRNEATGGEGCGVTGSFYVPLGPAVYGVTQDRPSAGTRAWPVPGDQGTNAMNAVIATGGTPVTVFANVFDSSAVGLSSVRLYYYVDSGRTLTSAPALAATAEYPNLPPYTALDLVPVAGNQWRTPTTPIDRRIPASDGANVWFFLVAVDNHGNFDRDPEVGSGAYQYYQQPEDYCANTPTPPALTGRVEGGNVVLEWTAPTTNTTGTAYLDARGYKVFRNGGSGWGAVATIEDPATLAYTDVAVPGLDTATYSYYVKAIDLCSPTARESDPSNTFTETLENPCNNTPNAPELAGTTDSAAGSVTLTWTAPTTNTSGSPLTDLVVYWIWRRKDLGSWTWIDDVPSSTLTYTDGGLADLGTADYQYYVEAVDSCTPSAKRSAPSNAYVDTYITTDPCVTVPSYVTGLTIEEASASLGVRLSWNAPTTQYSPAGWPYNDPGGYLVYRAEWTGSSYVNGVHVPDVWGVPPAPTTFTDASAAAGVGTKTYAYWVLAFDACPSRNYSSDSFGTRWDGPVKETYVDACATVPPPPTGLAVLSATGAGVSLDWAAPSPDPGDIAGYEIERKEGVAGTWAPIVGSPLYGGATAITDPVTDAGAREYYYRVRAFDSCAASNYSVYSAEAAEGYTDPCFAIPDFPTTPTLALTAVTPSNCNTATTSIAVAWNGANPDADTWYRIYRCYTTNTTTTASCTAELVYPAAEPPSPAQTTRTATLPTGGVKPGDYRIWMWVEGVNSMTGCTPDRWKVLRSAPMQDSCSP